MGLVQDFLKVRNSIKGFIHDENRSKIDESTLNDIIINFDKAVDRLRYFMSKVEVEEYFLNDHSFNSESSVDTRNINLTEVPIAHDSPPLDPTRQSELETKNADDDSSLSKSSSVIQDQIKLYSYAPEDDGSFSNDKKYIKDSPDRDTVFEFTLLNNTEAELSIVDDSKIHQIAITNYQTYLKRIVIKKSGSNLNARKIIVEEPGKYELINNKWVLKKKIIITLI